MAEKRSSISGLTDEEAQEFHKFWVQGFVGFTAVAVVAHFLVWAWRPWLN
jgi:light-harvesting complex 1 beta chain